MAVVGVHLKVNSDGLVVELDLDRFREFLEEAQRVLFLRFCVLRFEVLNNPILLLEIRERPHQNEQIKSIRDLIRELKDIPEGLHDIGVLRVRLLLEFVDDVVLIEGYQLHLHEADVDAFCD